MSKFSNTTTVVCGDRICPGLDDFAFMLPVFEFHGCDDAIYTSTETHIEDALPYLKYFRWQTHISTISQLERFTCLSGIDRLGIAQRRLAACMTRSRLYRR